MSRKLHSATSQGAMSAAAYSSPCDRMSDWLEELERTLTAFDGLPRAAQDAVNAVVESFVHDPETSQAEISHLNALLALHGMPHSDDGRHQPSDEPFAEANAVRPPRRARPLPEQLEPQARTATR